jgi:hypothetical protein
LQAGQTGGAKRGMVAREGGSWSGQKKQPDLPSIRLTGENQSGLLIGDVTREPPPLHCNAVCNEKSLIMGTKNARLGAPLSHCGIYYMMEARQCLMQFVPLWCFGELCADYLCITP